MLRPDTSDCTSDYLELAISTADEPLILHSLVLSETRYPLEMEGKFHCDDDRLNRMIPIMVRSLQMCSHETYMDGPYYEQLMYIGDTRLIALSTYIMTCDDELPRKALKMFNESRIVSGVTQARYPSKIVQIIPPFSLWWVCMIHDYWPWRNDLSFVRELLPGIRAVMEYFKV